MNHSTDPSLRSFDLLPQSYRVRNRVRQLRRSWLAVVMILVAAFIGSGAASVLNVHRQTKRDTEIACAALPLRQLRSDVMRLQESNDRREAWCQLVESAKPDDSALQAIAEIALASQNGNREILIDTLHLRFQVEPPVDATSVPQWVMPDLAIHARATTPAAQQGWFDRLNQSNRIQQLSFVGEGSTQGGAVRLIQDGLLHLQIDGTPLATRVLP